MNYIVKSNNAEILMTPVEQSLLDHFNEDLTLYKDIFILLQRINFLVKTSWLSRYNKLMTRDDRWIFTIWRISNLVITR